MKNEILDINKINEKWNDRFYYIMFTKSFWNSKLYNRWYKSKYYSVKNTAIFYTLDDVLKLCKNNNV